MNEDEIWKEKLKHIEGIDDRHSKRLRRFQKKFFDVLAAILAERLSFSDEGDLTQGTRNLTISTAVNSAWKEVSIEYEDVVAQLINEMLRGSNLTSAYMKFQTPVSKKYKLADKKAKTLLQRLLGFTMDGKKVALVKGGLFDTIIGDNSIRNDVSRVLIKAATGGSGYKATLSEVRGLIQGADGKLGKFERYYQTNVYDTLNQADRIHNKVFADELKLQAFTYSGTVIGKTRTFCKHRANKVFLVSEAEEWNDLKWGGKTKNYKPLRDLGGYNCRHVARFISDAKAARKRKDLFIDEKGKLKKK